MRNGFKSLAVAVAAFAVLGGSAIAAAAGAGGVTGGGAFYADGQLYRTVLTPTDLSHTGAPDHSFDTIYAIAEQTNVAEAKPGDSDYDGGRWRVRPVTFDDYGDAVAMYDSNGSGDFDSAEEVEAAVAGGDATVGSPIASFVCPVIKLPKG
ncbi:MAG: hypothetical protein O3C10_13790 [Chloroflexi bacterium]|nr:hypothetical protein [Chloroflexota bacterium]